MPQKLHKHQHLLVLILSWKQWKPRVQLNQNASKGPNVNRICVLYPKNYLWRPVKSRLNVSVKLFRLKTSTSHVNHLDSRLVLFFQQNIFGFQVAVNYFKVRKVHQCLQNLDRESSDQVQTESSEICLLQELVKIFVQQFKCYTSMASEMERVFHSYKVALELRVMKQGSFQDFNLNFGLGGKLLLGLDNFKGNILFFLMIEGFEHFSKRTPADIVDDLIFVSNGVANEDFGFSFRVSKIGGIVNSSFAEVKDFELGDLIFFKGSDFF
jgi:hypothetical protein